MTDLADILDRNIEALRRMSDASLLMLVLAELAGCANIPVGKKIPLIAELEHRAGIKL